MARSTQVWYAICQLQNDQTLESKRSDFLTRLQHKKYSTEPRSSWDRNIQISLPNYEYNTEPRSSWDRNIQISLPNYEYNTEPRSSWNRNIQISLTNYEYSTEPRSCWDQTKDPCSEKISK